MKSPSEVNSREDLKDEIVRRTCPSFFQKSQTASISKNQIYLICYFVSNLFSVYSKIFFHMPQHFLYFYKQNLLWKNL